MLIFIILKGDTSHWAIKDQKRCTGRPLRFSFPPNWAERKIQLIFAIKLSKEGEYLNESAVCEQKGYAEAGKPELYAAAV